MTLFDPPFQAYAVVSGSMVELDIDFDCYSPRIAVELTTVIEKSINYHYHAEPPLCGSCEKEAGT